MNDNKPSRELDVLVAEKVFGATITHLNQQSGWRIDYVANKPGLNEGIPTDYGYDGYRLRYYSSEIAAAWEIVTHMLTDGWSMKTISSQLGGTDVEFVCITGARGRFVSDLMEGLNIDAPHAICLAALRAVGVKV